MSKQTIAALLPSTTRQGPWGDPGWLPAGVIQYVASGPDFLWGAGRSVGEPASQRYTPFASMEVREQAARCAADIAVMALAMLDVDGWHDLERWWDDTDYRDGLMPHLRELLSNCSGMFKIGIVRFTTELSHQEHVAEIASELDKLGLPFSLFDETV